MELKSYGDVLDLGFQVPAEGTYNWEILDGIDLNYNENSGKTTLKIPLEIESVIDGDVDAKGQKTTHFIPIETPFGEKQLCVFLEITGLLDSFIQRFGETPDVMSKKFITALNLKLAGKIIKGTHVVEKNQKGNDQVNFRKFESSVRGKGGAGGKVSSGGSGKKKDKPDVKKDEPDDDGWE